MNEELKIIISAEIDSLKKGVAEAKKNITDLTSKGGSGFKQFEAAVTKAGGVSNKILKTTAGAVAGVGGALLALVPATEEYRNAQAKLDAAWESCGKTAEQAGEAYNGLYRFLGDSDVAVEAAGHLAQLNLSQEENEQMVKALQGVYATFGDSLPIEGLTEAINHTSKLGEVQGVLADALEWSGISADEFNAQLAKCNTEREREQLILATLSGEYNAASESYEEFAAGLLAQQEAEAKMAEATAQLGEALQPVMTSLTELGADVLADLAPYVDEFAEESLPEIQEALDGVGETVGEVMTFIGEHWEIIATIGGIILGIAAAISILSTGLSIYNTVTAITAAVNLAAVGPILLIVAGIAALIAIIVVCVKHWDEIKAAIDNFVENAINAIDGFVEGVKEKFEAAKEAVSEKVEAIKTAVSEKFENIKSTATEKFEAVKTTISDKVQGAKDTVLGVFDNIKSGISDKINNARDTVKGAIEKIKGFFKFKWELPKIKLPHFSISGKFSLNPPSIPKFSVSWYQKGGIFDKPTLFGYGNGMLGGLGENGAEAVVPLEKNTEWMNVLANKLSERMGGSSTPIILQVDGKTFAQTSISAINSLTKQTGNLGLNLY